MKVDLPLHVFLNVSRGQMSYHVASRLLKERKMDMQDNWMSLYVSSQSMQLATRLHHVTWSNMGHDSLYWALIDQQVLVDVFCLQ